MQGSGLEWTTSSQQPLASRCALGGRLSGPERPPPETGVSRGQLHFRVVAQHQLWILRNWSQNAQRLKTGQSAVPAGPACGMWTVPQRICRACIDGGSALLPSDSDLSAQLSRDRLRRRLSRVKCAKSKTTRLNSRGRRPRHHWLPLQRAARAWPVVAVNTVALVHGFTRSSLYQM